MSLRVLIVACSATVRDSLRRQLDGLVGIEVVGTAGLRAAPRKIARLRPDAVTIDPSGADGRALLSSLQASRLPVVVVSPAIRRGSVAALEARRLGAFDVIGADEHSHPKRMQALLAGRLHEAVKKARHSGAAPPPQRWGRRTQLIAIGASTGGTRAVRQLLAQLPADGPPIVYSQHLPRAHSASFAQRLDRASALTVRLSHGGEPLRRGCVYVSPGEQHLTVTRQGTQLLTRLRSTPPVNGHRPSVDVLFESVALIAGGSSLGILLTGMGNDGARGLLLMREANALTIAQDEASSVVWGMPGSAVKLGAAAEVLALGEIAARILAA